MTPYRIGCGAGFSADRLPPAVDLAQDGELDCLILECVGERTLAFGHRDRLANQNGGYNTYLVPRLRALLPACRQNGVTIVTNMGVANPLAAGERAAGVARELGLSGLRIAVVCGDDVTELIGDTTPLWEGGNVADLNLKMVGANVYLGVEHILPAMDADLIITGRVADPSLTLAPLVHHFAWGLEEWDKLACGTLAGHLIECGMQVSGGYFADPGYKEVPDLANCGYPIAIIDGGGSTRLEKLPGSGGLINEATIKEQLLYEVHDPSAYQTPDVTADFGKVRIEELGANVVRLAGATGRKRPEHLKATIGFNAGYLAEAGISYAGDGAASRAQLARDILQKRLVNMGIEIRYDIVGFSALHSTARKTGRTDDCRDARLRIAARNDDPEVLETVLWETEALLCSGPAAGGGFRRQVTPSVVTYSTSIERQSVNSVIEWITV